MAETALKGLTMSEMKLLSDFSNVVQAREYNSQVDVQKLVLSYDATVGFTIELVEKPKTDSEE